jgi:membrane fusion protein (multidrug efflux system)
VELQTDIAGRVIAIGFDEGAHVSAGGLLVKIYDADLQASLERAVARRKLAGTRADRIESLFEHGGTNRQEYDAALSEVEVQEAEIRLIEAQISKTEIRAPFDGVVGLRAVSLGAYVAPATRIATLQRIDRIKLDFAVPEKFAARIQPGSAVSFTVSGNPEVFSGSVYAAEPRVDINTRTVQVRATVDNSHGLLRPGAFAQVEFKVSERDDALLVPAESVIPGLSDKNVFVVVDGRAARRTVWTGTRTDTEVHIVKGLSAGDLIITSGLHTLRAGSLVDVTETE